MPSTPTPWKIMRLIVGAVLAGAQLVTDPDIFHIGCDQIQAVQVGQGLTTVQVDAPASAGNLLSPTVRYGRPPDDERKVGLPALTEHLSAADVDRLRETVRSHPGWVVAAVGVVSAILALPVVLVFRAVSGPFQRRGPQR
jgi:hypothetical protein